MLLQKKKNEERKNQKRFLVCFAPKCAKSQLFSFCSFVFLQVANKTKKTKVKRVKEYIQQGNVFVCILDS